MTGWHQGEDIEWLEERMRNAEGREPLERECEAARHLIANWWRAAKRRLNLHSPDE